MAAAIPFVMGGLSAASSLQGSAAQTKQLNNQAAALDARAIEVRKQGSDQAKAIRDQRDQVIGSTVSQAAGSGVEVGTGSVLDAIEQSAFNIEMDALKTTETAEKTARSMELEGRFSRAGAPSGLTTLLGATGSGMSGYSAGLSMV